MTDLHFPETFVAQRDEDVSGVSGEGVIAEGCRFSDGWVVTHWLDQPPMHEPKTDVWHHKGVTPFRKIHGHGGRTRIVWADEAADARRKNIAALVEAFDVPPEICGPEAEGAHLRERIEQALSDAAALTRTRYTNERQLGVVSGPVEVQGTLSELADAVVPIVASVLQHRNRARETVGRVSRLAKVWQAAHGSANFLVRAAGVELADVLDEIPGAPGEVAQPERSSQVSEPDGVGESGLTCVCGDPVIWTEHSFDPGWIHAPGSDTKCTHARPRCPECQMPHALIPSRPPWCRSIRTHLAETDHVAAAECSALHTRFTPSRQCIRAAQHRGDHIDEHGFHWSDTVAVYPVFTGEPQHSQLTSSCSKPDHACVTCGDCAYEHPGEGGCFDPDRQPADQGPLTRIDVRTACPYCTGAPMFGSSELAAHIRDKHARVQAVLASGGCLDEQLADPETRCRLPHEMGA